MDSRVAKRFHRRLNRLGWPTHTFAFHDNEEVGPVAGYCTPFRVGRWAVRKRNPTSIVLPQKKILDAHCTTRNNTPVIPFRVTFRPGASLYEQVVYAAKKALVSRQMRPGDPFPSVRTLSTELRINPNTAHKVITQLLNEGLLEVRPGTGTVVAEPPHLPPPSARACSKMRSSNS
jgi:DNA-binding transcriptional regulator YhcF (GntR family)